MSYVFDYQVVRTMMRNECGSVTDFCKKYNINKVSENSWNTGKLCIRLVELIEMMNRHRYPISLAIRPEGATLDESKIKPVPANRFIPTYFYHERLHALFMATYGMPLRISEQEAADKMGVSLNAFKGWTTGYCSTTGKPTITADKMVELANECRLNLRDILWCPCAKIKDEFQPVPMNETLMRKWLDESDQHVADAVRSELNIRTNMLERLEQLFNMLQKNNANYVSANELYTQLHEDLTMLGEQAYAGTSAPSKTYIVNGDLVDADFNRERKNARYLESRERRKSGRGRALDKQTSQEHTTPTEL